MYTDVFCVKDHLLHPETGKTRDQYLQREQHHQGWVATPHNASGCPILEADPHNGWQRAVISSSCTMALFCESNCEMARFL